MHDGAVVAAMRSSTATDDQIKKLQGQLLKAYNAFVKEYGTLNSQPNTEVVQARPRSRHVARARGAEDDGDAHHQQGWQEGPARHA